MKKYFFPVFWGLCFIFFSCATTANKTQLTENRQIIPQNFLWEPVEENNLFCPIQKCTVKITESCLIYHLIKIDLSSNRVCLYDSINTENRNLDLETYSKEKTVVINSSPFSIDSKIGRIFPGKNTKIENVGIHKSKGIVKSAPVSKYSALMFSFDADGTLRASVSSSQTEKKVTACDYAFGGFFLCLEDYAPGDYLKSNFDSRTMAGVSEDGKTLVLLVAEGEKSSSLGLSFPECAEIFLALGLKDGIGFDGGASTALYINGKNYLSYKCISVHSSGIGFSLKK